MYFYAITGKQNVKQITETTNDEGEIVLVTTTVQVDIKTPISREQANEYVKNDTYPVYCVDDDGTEELIELYSDDDPPEELVGAKPIQGAPSQILTVTEQTIAVPRASAQENDYRLAASVTPTKTGYHLLGVVGFRVVGTSNVVPFRVAYESGEVTVGLRNLATTHVDSVNVKLCLLWMADDWTTEQAAPALLQAPTQEGNEEEYDDELQES